MPREHPANSVIEQSEERMRSDIDTALEEIRVTQNRDPTAAEVLDAEARAARLLPQRAMPVSYTHLTLPTTPYV